MNGQIQTLGEEEDEDLKRAIELSMAESQPKSDRASSPDIVFVKSEKGSSAIKSAKPVKAEKKTNGDHAASSSTGTSTAASTGPSKAMQEQLNERLERMKGKEMSSGNASSSSSPAKRPNLQSVASTSSAFANSSVPRNNYSYSSSSSISMSYPKGALRITRTPGRQNDRNTISLEDLISKNHLVAACIFSFFIAELEFFPHLPFSRTSDAVPIYIGRDAKMCPFTPIACSDAGIEVKGKVSNKQLETIKPALRRMYKQEYGQNYHAFYAWSAGSSHSKLMALVYPTFLRIVITSCNMMNIDTELGDNHWYIHDVPKWATQSRSLPEGFEGDFLAHLQSLSVPDDFLDSIRGYYDYSSVKVSLVTSIPGTHSGAKAEKYGLLRLRKVVKDLGLKLPNKLADEEVELEICTASLGNLNAKWLDGLSDCMLGRKTLQLEEDVDVPALKIVYPTKGDVKRCHEESQMAASNIGCHTRPWDGADKAIKKLFHHYASKDDKRLFHQKLLMALDITSKTALPYYIYIGSGNLSASAWGTLEEDKKGNKATSDMKCAKISNYECGVMIPGTLLTGLLEAGTANWHAGVITYERPAVPYDHKVDKPWSDPRWVKGASSGNDDYYGNLGACEDGGNRLLIPKLSQVDIIGVEYQLLPVGFGS